MPAPYQAPDWNRIASEYRQRFAGLADTVEEYLKQLLAQAREVVRCSETAVMLPTEDGERLRFAVAVNSTEQISTALADILVPCAGSLAGCVYNTGQTIAVTNPPDFYQQVDAKTGLKTEIYLVTPMLQQDEVLGVATFLNRPTATQEPFTTDEIAAAEHFSDLLAMGVAFLRRLQTLEKLLAAELDRTIELLTSEVKWSDEIDASEEETLPDEARMVLLFEKLTSKDQQLAVDLVRTLAARHREHESDP